MQNTNRYPLGNVLKASCSVLHLKWANIGLFADVRIQTTLYFLHVDPFKFVPGSLFFRIWIQHIFRRKLTAGINKMHNSETAELCIGFKSSF